MDQANHDRFNCPTSDLDQFVGDVQRLIDDEDERIYSKAFLEEYRNPQNMGQMADPDAASRITGPCGDTMELHLRITGEKISKAVFMTDGCGATVACGSRLTGAISGMDLDRARELTAAYLARALGGLPSEDEHCAVLAINTLQAALKRYLAAREAGKRS